MVWNWWVWHLEDIFAERYRTGGWHARFTKHNFCINGKQANDLVGLLGFVFSYRKLPGGSLVRGRPGPLLLILVAGWQPKGKRYGIPVPLWVPKEPFWSPEAQFGSAFFPCVCSWQGRVPHLPSNSLKCCFNVFWLFIIVFDMSYHSSSSRVAPRMHIFRAQYIRFQGSIWHTPFRMVP